MAELSIPIHDLDTQGKDFVFALDQSWLERVLANTGIGGDTSHGPGAVEVHAQRNGREILVHGHARATLVSECVRCLTGVPLEVECDLAALYAPATAADARAAGLPAAEEEDDVNPNEPDREFYTGDRVVIDDLVRDYLLLELPMQPRCEPACELDLPEQTHSPEGAQATDSGEGPIDPRLAPLMKLAKKGERQKE